MTTTAGPMGYAEPTTRDFFAAAVFTDDLIRVQQLGSVDAMQAFLLLNKWRKFSSHRNFRGRQDGWLDIPEKSRNKWGVGQAKWFAALTLLENADLIETRQDENGSIVVWLLTDVPTYS